MTDDQHGTVSGPSQDQPVEARADRSEAASAVNYDLFLDCVHCGLCTSSCPTYVILGNENDSPRGRIHLMRAVSDGRIELTSSVRRHLELCLDCRGCETACPSGVRYGRLIEPFRLAMERDGASGQRDWFHRHVIQGIFPYPDKLRRNLWPARLAQRLFVDRLLVATGLWRLLPRRVGRLLTMLPPRRRSSPPLPHVLPPKGRRRARVALFTGCVADVLLRDTHWATARVLQENGCEVVVLHSQVCCGAIHLHSGAEDEARRLADTNTSAFNANDVDAVIANVAGCGAMLKEYPHHWPENGSKQREQFAAKVRDVNEFLDQLPLVPPTGTLELTATYHDACHLAHAQQIREAPRRLLRQIPGLRLVELPESDLCCGAAGTYNLTETAMADQLARRKLDNILATGAEVVATANAGCLLQIARQARLSGHRLPVVHPVELLDLSYREQPFRR